MKNNENELNRKVRNSFEEKFSQKPLLVHAPGRINLIGDHTDYNNGYVLPAAIDRGITMALAKNGTDTCRLFSLDLKDMQEVSLNTGFIRSDKGWANYIIGVLDGLNSRGTRLEGFDAVFSGNIPIGSGLSSSAALECAAVMGISELLGESLDKEEMIHIAQEAEHKFAGVNCGIMDQFSSVMGKEGHAIRLDCESLQHEYLPLDIKNAGLVLFDTKVSHSLGDSAYNQRRMECETGVSVLRQFFPEVRSLRDADAEMLETVEMPETVFRRCLYVIEENERVVKAGTYLKSGLGKELGKLMFESHDGLSGLYEVSCPELDHLVTEAKKLPQFFGSRMMGGGFGGCTINLISDEGREEGIEKIRSSFGQRFGRELGVYHVQAVEGAHVVT
jgi:galactokinase